MLTKDFDYDLPSELIAQEPTAQRGESSLLVVPKSPGSFADLKVKNLLSALEIIFGSANRKIPAGTQSKTLFIRNQSKVYPARVPIQRATGAQGEVFILNENLNAAYSVLGNLTEHHDKNEIPRKVEPRLLSVLLRPQKKLSVGETLYASCATDLQSDSSQTLKPLFEVVEIGQQKCLVRSLLSLEDLLFFYGNMPLPPYIRRKGGISTEADATRYQNVYATELGSAAAPTAGLHFTEKILSDLEDSGLVKFCSVTLHVGLGTFRPVQVESPLAHEMHSEIYSVSKQTVYEIYEALENQWPIVFLGTTSFRAVESLFIKATELLHSHASEFSAEKMKFECSKYRSEFLERLLPFLLLLCEQLSQTDLFVFPGRDGQLTYTPFVGEAIFTNFHQPQSTLLMLIAALAGFDQTMAAYSHAVSRKYRFLSYGDATLFAFSNGSKLSSNTSSRF